MKEFNLSEKIDEVAKNYDSQICDIEGINNISVKDVKEFIKRLKKAYDYYHEGNRHEILFKEMLNKLAGEKLT